MKKFTILALLLSFVTIGFMSCNKDTTITCNLAADPDTAQAAMDVFFKADKTGDGTISSLTYQVGSTTKTVTNPTLPWSITVSAEAGDVVSITATGTTSDGSLSISYDGENGESQIKGEDYCSHSNK